VVEERHLRCCGLADCDALAGQEDLVAPEHLPLSQLIVGWERACKSPFAAEVSDEGRSVPELWFRGIRQQLARNPQRVLARSSS
jgi:hypothetical protein